MVRDGMPERKPERITEREIARFREDAAGRIRRMETEFLDILCEEAIRELRLRGVEVKGIRAESAPERRKAGGRKAGRGKAEKGLVAEFRGKVLGHARVPEPHVRRKYHAGIGSVHPETDSLAAIARIDGAGTVPYKDPNDQSVRLACSS